MSLNKDMGDAHEKRIAEAIGARLTRGSGNQPANQMDARHSRHHQRFALAVDGKSTLGKSVSVTREMWQKAIDQAHGERPVLGLCFYDDERLRSYTDLIVLSMDDFAELVGEAEREMTPQEWLQYGIDNELCTDSVCATHNGLPSTPSEDEEWDQGYDPCVPCVRLL